MPTGYNNKWRNKKINPIVTKNGLSQQVIQWFNKKLLI